MDPVVHFELPYEDAQRVSTFYRRVFGWQTQLLDDQMGGYMLATTALTDARKGAQAGAINGGFFKRTVALANAMPTIVIAVQNIGNSMRKVQEAGGTVLGEPTAIPGVGKYVSFVDSEGNRASILEPAPGS